MMSEAGARSEAAVSEQPLELELLRESAAKFAARHGGGAQLRRRRDAGVDLDRAVWKELAEGGFLTFGVPEEFGGLGLSLDHGAAAAEEFGKALLIEPFIAGALLAASVLVRSDNPVLRQRLLPAVAGGELAVAVAWEERPDSMVDRTILTRSAEVPGGFELNGLKRFVRPGPAADGFIVSARTDAGTIGLYWVPRESTGVELGVGRLADGSLVADVTLRKVHVAAESVVWSSSTPGCPLTAALDEALILTSAELLGVAGHTLAITLEHLRFRKQFGKPIGSFQALQHRAVNAHIQLQLAGAALESAIRAHRAEDPLARSLAASRVKGRCSETALAIGREAVQMHGAVGVTEEYDVGLYLKRALVQSAWLGNASQHRRRYAGLGAGRGSGDA